MSGASRHGPILVFSLALLSATLPMRAARADDPPKQEELPRRQATFVWSLWQSLLASFTASFTRPGHRRERRCRGSREPGRLDRGQGSRRLEP